ncbi:MAG: NfeD family protein, partial [Phycisphaerales bacterium]|nr:NfeD family protein [Phycisphaerales bacterium]
HATDGRWPIVGVIAVAIAGGCVVWLIQAALLRSMMRLQTSGNISIQQALGSVGTVYTLVPAPGRGSGQVRLVVDGRQRIFGAVSEGPELASQTRVKVIKVNDDNTLVVAPAD